MQMYVINGTLNSWFVELAMSKKASAGLPLVMHLLYHALFEYVYLDNESDHCQFLSFSSFLLKLVPH